MVGLAGIFLSQILVMAAVGVQNARIVVDLEKARALIRFDLCRG